MVDTGNKTGFPAVRPVDTPKTDRADEHPISNSPTNQSPSSLTHAAAPDTFARSTAPTSTLDASRPTQGLWSERRGQKYGPGSMGDAAGSTSCGGSL